MDGVWRKHKREGLLCFDHNGTLSAIAASGGWLANGWTGKDVEGNDHGSICCIITASVWWDSNKNHEKSSRFSPPRLESATSRTEISATAWASSLSKVAAAVMYSGIYTMWPRTCKDLNTIWCVKLSFPLTQYNKFPLSINNMYETSSS